MVLTVAKTIFTHARWPWWSCMWQHKGPYRRTLNGYNLLAPWCKVCVVSGCNGLRRVNHKPISEGIFCILPILGSSKKHFVFNWDMQQYNSFLIYQDKETSMVFQCKSSPCASINQCLLHFIIVGLLKTFLFKLLTKAHTFLYSETQYHHFFMMRPGLMQHVLKLDNSFLTGERKHQKLHW